MNNYIALFKAINVGGNNILPMKQLATLLEQLGCQQVKTYIQSGNAVLQSTAKNTEQLSTQIRAEIKHNFGFEPQLLLLELAELEQVIYLNPFPEAETEPNQLHVNFLLSMPTTPDLAGLEKLKTETEHFKLQGRIFYLHAPDGIGRSKLVANLEKLLGVGLTCRNWRTVCKIAALAKQ